VRGPKAPPSGYRLVYDNVSGELGLQLLLRQHGVADDESKRAAAGWGGDRLQLWSPKQRPGDVLAAVATDLVVMDSEAEARELYAALGKAAPRLAGGAALERTADRAAWLTDSGSVVTIERRGDAVLLMIGAPPARAVEMAARVWTGASR
jgi:hypothetical protein